MRQVFSSFSVAVLLLAALAVFLFSFPGRRDQGFVNASDSVPAPAVEESAVKEPEILNFRYRYGLTCLQGSYPRVVREATASWYDSSDDGLTASMEMFNSKARTAAHLKLPFGTLVRVTDLKTGDSVEVRVNDRGPYIQGREIDLTKGAMWLLGGNKALKGGIVRVRLEIIRLGPEC